MNKSLSLLSLIVLGTLIISCNPSKKEEQSSISTANVKEVVEREFAYPIPTSFEVTNMLQEANAAFIMDITNPVANVNKYETQRDKALNLGIYGADLSYASTYNSREETMALFKVSKSLVDALQIPGVFNDNMMTRMESNIENKDSLILIVTESFYNTYDQLGKSGQDKMGFLVVSGSWIEGLYITCQLAMSSNYNPKIMTIIAEQKNSAKILSEIAAKYAKEDPDVESIRPFMEFMNIVFEGVDPTVGITKGQLDDIYNNVASTRNEIIE